MLPLIPGSTMAKAATAPAPKNAGADAAKGGGLRVPPDGQQDREDDRQRSRDGPGREDPARSRGHPPEQRSAAEGEAQEEGETDHRPRGEGVAGGPGDAEDRHQGAPDGHHEPGHRQAPEPSGGELRDRFHEFRVHPGGQDHGAAAHPRDEAGEPREDPGDGAAAEGSCRRRGTGPPGSLTPSVYGGRRPLRDSPRGSRATIGACSPFAIWRFRGFRRSPSRCRPEACSRSPVRPDRERPVCSGPWRTSIRTAGTSGGASVPARPSRPPNGAGGSAFSPRSRVSGARRSARTSRRTKTPLAEELAGLRLDPEVRGGRPGAALHRGAVPAGAPAAAPERARGPAARRTHREPRPGQPGARHRAGSTATAGSGTPRWCGFPTFPKWWRLRTGCSCCRRARSAAFPIRARPPAESPA